MHNNVFIRSLCVESIRFLILAFDSSFLIFDNTMCDGGNHYFNHIILVDGLPQKNGVRN
jgi:hypothetical protein